MKESPILMDAESVRGVLDGYKSQTRRLVKHRRCHSVPPGCTLADVSRSAFPDGSGLGWIFNSTLPSPGSAEWTKKMYPGNEGINCPFGNVGDRLWVRETWQPTIIEDCGTAINYRATDKIFSEKNPEVPWEGFTSDVDAYEWTCEHYKPHWIPSIHMPRWASRLTLEITNVKAELLHDINEEDAKAEGIREKKGEHGSLWFGALWESTPVEAFKGRWESIHGKGSWKKNLWLWAISFKQIPHEQGKIGRIA